MRTSSIVESGSDEVASSSNTANNGLRFLVVGTLVVLVALLAFVLTRGKTPAPSSVQTAAVVTKADPLADLPEELRSRPDRIGSEIKLTATKVQGGAVQLVQAIAEARSAGRIPVRTEWDAPVGAPQDAETLSFALRGEQVKAADSFELSVLAAALLEAKGYGPVAYGVDQSVAHSATDLRRRRYLVKAGAGDWLAPDGQPIDATQVRSLTSTQSMAQVLAWRALGARASGDDELASKASNQARALAPDDAAVVFTAGLMAHQAGLVDHGISTMEEAAAINADARTWFDLGRAALEASQAFKAAQYLKKAVTVDSSFTDPHVVLALMALDRLRTTPRTEHAARLTEAREHLTAAEAIDPKASGIRTTKAQVALLEQKIEEAEALLQEEVRLNPGHESGWASLVQVLIMQDKVTEALTLLSEAEQKGHARAELLALYGAILAQTGELPKGLTMLEKALNLAPASVELRKQLAQVHLGLGQADKAKTLLNDQINRFGDDVEARLLLSQVFIDGAEYAAALKQLDEVEKMSPGDQAVAMLRYVTAIQSQKGLEKAREGAVKSMGSRSEVAQFLLAQGFGDEAEKLLREAIAKAPEDSAAAVLLYAFLTATERAEEAATVKGDALARAPEDERANLDAEFSRVLNAVTVSELPAPDAAAEAPPTPPTPSTPPGTPAP